MIKRVVSTCEGHAASITVFLENGGAIEMAQYMVGHADPRTTKLYDRRRQQATRGEVERIRYEKKQSMPKTSEEG